MKTRRLLLIASAVLVTADIHAQAIFGAVRTTAGVPVEGVVVRLRRSLQLIDTFVTDAGGGYVLGSGLSGVYTVDPIEANGYTFTPPATNVTVSGSSVRVDFTTPATAPAISTLSASSIRPDFAVLQFQVRPNGASTTVSFEYGLTADYGNISEPRNMGNGTSFIISGINVPGLSSSTTYHYRAVASNSFGVRFGEDATFTTPSGIPTVVTLPPTQLGASTARLNGSANPNGAPGVIVWFDLGTTTNYGNVPTPQFLIGTNLTNFSQMLIALTVGTTYHYRAAASTAFGTNHGADVYFTPLFTDAFATNVPNAAYGGLAWGDYDNDGRLDVVANSMSGVWRNTGGGFVLNTNAGLPYAADGSVAWGDYDSDGWLDILLTGWSWPVTTTGVARVYRNNRDGTFSDIHAGLPGIHRSSAVWGDYNNDGRLDILLAGMNVNTNPITQVWRNTGSGFVHDTNAALTGISHGALAWGDYDNDGRLDILLAGSPNSTDPFSQPTQAITELWRNTGNGFSKTNTGLPGVVGQNNHSAVAWGDYDNDGRVDILLAGRTNASPASAICQVWRNTGSGFVFSAALTGVFDCAVAWGDCDNDGRLDILLSGSDAGFVQRTEVWRNTGTGFFNLNAGLLGNYDGGVAWGDHNNDGRLDILVSGLNSSNDKLWRNNIPTTNVPPSVPSGLSSSFANSAMTLSWNAATDSETPANGLTYNVRIGTTPGGADVVSGMADANGLRRVAQPGNAGHRLSLTLNLPSMNTPYYWSVQAIDGALAGSPFAAESTFKLLPVLVPPAATSVIPGDLNGDGVVDESELASVLSNYFPTSPWLQMTNVAGLGGTNVTFALTNDLAGAFSVEYTTNLMDWFFLGPATPRYEFTDTNAPAVPQRHYRLRWP